MRVQNNFQRRMRLPSRSDRGLIEALPRLHLAVNHRFFRHLRYKFPNIHEGLSGAALLTHKFASVNISRNYITTLVHVYPVIRGVGLCRRR
jgi:hypothetical protein